MLYILALISGLVDTNVKNHNELNNLQDWRQFNLESSVRLSIVTEVDAAV
jgi:hypothetical protein